jgi:excisionase family DNA binding protein
MSARQDPPRIAWSPREVSQMTGMSYSTVIEGIHAGEVPATKVGTRYVIPAEWVEQVRTTGVLRRAS